MKPLAFEEVLEQVGSKGLHQHLLLWAFIVPLSFFTPVVFLGQLFFASTPGHHCAAPPPPPDNVTAVLSQYGNTSSEIWENIAIPSSDGKLDECRQYNLTWADLLALPASQINSNSLQQMFGETTCRHGYVYDTSEFDATLPSTMNWVCDSKLLGSTWLTVGACGRIIGCLLLQPLADVIGRRKVIILASWIFVVFGIMRVFVTSLWAVMVTQFISNMPFPNMFQLSNIIVLEQVSPDWRAQTNAISFISWTGGMCALPLLAWLIPDWRNLCLSTIIPYAIFAVTFWFIPESPSWLLSRGKQDETVDLLLKISKRNKRDAPNDLKDQVARIENKEQQQKDTVVALLKTPLVRTRTVLMTLCYTGNMFVYNGPTYNLENMSGNRFLNFFFISVIELPGNLLAWRMVDFIGRRWSQVIGFLASAILLLCAIPLVEYSWWFNSTLATLCKLANCLSFLGIYLQLQEIFPTSLRSSGCGLASVITNCFGTTLPYIAVTSGYWKGMPYAILSAIAVISMIASFLLPETLGEMLPQDIEDAKTFLKDEKLWSYKGKKLSTPLCCRRRQNRVNPCENNGTPQEQIN